MNQHNTVKRDVQPTNKLEEQYLNQQKINSLHNNIWVEKIIVKSALDDLMKLEQEENGWPTKEVVEERVVSYPCRLTNTMVTDTTQRVTHVPMGTEEGLAELERRIHEQREHYYQLYPQAFQLPGKPKKPAKPKAAPKKAKKAPAKAKKSNVKG